MIIQSTKCNNQSLFHQAPVFAAIEQALLIVGAAGSTLDQAALRAVHAGRGPAAAWSLPHWFLPHLRPTQAFSKLPPEKQIGGRS